MNKLFKRIVSIAMSASMCMSGGIAAAHAEDDPSWSFLPFEEINTDQTNVEGCSGLYDYAAWRSNEADETKFSVGSFGVYNCEWDLTDSALFMTGHCWFVNDVRQIKSKNLTTFKESLDVIGRRLPIEWTHREIVVFSAVNS